MAFKWRKLLGLSLIAFMFYAANMGLAADKKVKFVTCNFEPFFGETLPDNGPFAEITKAAFEKMGYTFELKIMPWSRALSEAEAGNFDGVVGGYMNDDRKKIYDFTDPVAKDRIVFVKKKGSKVEYTGLKNLAGVTVGAMQDYAYTEEFKNATNFKREYVTDPKANILKLMNDRVDLIVDSQEVIFYLARDQKPSVEGQLEALNPPLAESMLYNLITKKGPNHATILQDFNAGLKKITADGTLAKIASKHKFKGAI